MTMENKNIFSRLIDAIVRFFSEIFGQSGKHNGIDLSKIEAVELPKDFKETVELSDVVAYFKGLLGKIKQGEDTPFVALTDRLQSVTPSLGINNPDSSLLLATYNEKTEMVENVMILEYKELGETLKRALEKSENGIVTLS